METSIARRDQEADQLDAVEDGDGLLLAEARVEQLEPDLAKLLRIGGSQRLAQLAGSGGDLGLKCFLPLGEIGLGGLGGAALEQTAQAVFGGAWAAPRPCPESTRRPG